LEAVAGRATPRKRFHDLSKETLTRIKLALEEEAGAIKEMPEEMEGAYGGETGESVLPIKEPSMSPPVPSTTHTPVP